MNNRDLDGRMDYVLSRFDNVKGSGDNFSARCPAHNDKNNSLSIGRGRDGRILLNCHRGCSFNQIMSAAGLAGKDVGPSSATTRREDHPSLSLADFSTRKGLDLEFLRKCGVHQTSDHLVLTYYKMDGTPADRHRVRRHVVAKKGSAWTAGHSGDIVPYGLQHLGDARKKSELTLVEGETDWLTLRFHGYPALGIPGVQLVKSTLRAEHLQGIQRIYAVREPDGGGVAFIENISDHLRNLRWGGSAYVVTMPTPLKDVNDLHRQNQAAFCEAFEARRSAAVPLIVGRREEGLPEPERCIEKDGLVFTLANAIQQENHFARLGGELYVYRNGVYCPAAEDMIAVEVKRLVNKWRETSRWTPALAKQVTAYVVPDVPLLPDVPSSDTVNVLNGLVDIKTGELRAHSPEHLSVLQLPVRFDDHATCPRWDGFVADVFPFDTRELAFEIAGLLMVPDVRFQKAFLLNGPGGTGKSTYLEALRAFLGSTNVSSISLEQLGERFHAYGLVGKLANISGEQRFHTISTTAMFKQIVGGDVIQVERKHLQPFPYN